MPRPPRTREKTRLNLELTRTVRDRLERLQASTEAESLTEVIRRALEVYEDLNGVRMDGGRVIVEDNDGHPRELRLL